MFNKKFIAILLSILLILANLNFNQAVAKSTADTTPPEFKSFTIDKQNAIVGDTINFTVDATDDMSGIKSIYIIYKTPVTNKSEIIYLHLTNGIYVGSKIITSSDEGGIWKIGEIVISDNTSNNTQIWNTANGYNGTDNNGSKYQDLSSGNFKISGTTADVTPPVFKSFTMDKQNAIVGDAINFTLDATDDMSGIKSIYIIYRTPVTNRSEFIYLHLTNGIYVGSKTITSSDEEGTWKIGEIVISDNTSNNIQIWNTANGYNGTDNNGSKYQDLSSGNFKISGTTADITPPVFKSFTMDKQNAIVGDTINFTVDATDDMSGIKSIYIIYRTPVTNKSEFIYLHLTNGIYIGSKTTTSSDEGGTWKIGEIVISDNTSNNTQIWNTANGYNGIDNNGSKYRDLSSGSFKINIPVIGVKLDKTTASLKVGEEVTLEATINPLEASNKNVTWTSSNTSVATVDNEGKVTAISKGTATIATTTEDGGYTSSCAVTVVNLLKEDVNKDGVIDSKDIALITSKYNYENTNINWNADYDINNDFIIDIYDLVLVSKLLK